MARRTTTLHNDQEGLYTRAGRGDPTVDRSKLLRRGDTKQAGSQAGWLRLTLESGYMVGTSKLSCDSSGIGATKSTSVRANKLAGDQTHDRTFAAVVEGTSKFSHKRKQRH